MGAMGARPQRPRGSIQLSKAASGSYRQTRTMIIAFHPLLSDNKTQTYSVVKAFLLHKPGAEAKSTKMCDCDGAIGCRLRGEGFMSVDQGSFCESELIRPEDSKPRKDGLDGGGPCDSSVCSGLPFLACLDEIRVFSLKVLGFWEE